MACARILIGGDFLPIAESERQYSEGNLSAVFDPRVLDILSSSDMRLFNLEGPITSSSTPIRKDAPSLKATPSSLAGIKALEPTLLGMANNHIRDYGREGIQETLQLLDEAGIKSVGCGLMPNAADPVISQIQGITIAVFAMAEHEFSIATGGELGANPVDLADAVHRIADAQSIADFIIVLYHGGKEKYRYPTPMQLSAMRCLGKAGADLVIAQHSHCVGCYETMGNSTLVYGQGNFHFSHEHNEFYDTALLCVVTVSKNTDNTESEISWVPIEMNEKGMIKLSEGRTRARTLDGFLERSIEIRQRGFVEQHYKEFCRTIYYDFEKTIMGRGLDGMFYRLIGKLSHQWASRFFCSVYGKDLPALLNSYRCETHREIVLRMLNEHYLS